MLAFILLETKPIRNSDWHFKLTVHMREFDRHDDVRRAILRIRRTPIRKKMNTKACC